MKSARGILLFHCYVAASVSGNFKVVGPAGPVLAFAGDDLVLPCQLQPNISAVNMTVEWVRLHAAEPLVYFYEDHEGKNANQPQSYRGRTTLFKEELQTGNASLKLSKVTLSDEGEYRCSVQSGSMYDDAVLHVIVEAIGTHPVVSMERYSGSGGLCLLCEIKDWSPEPQMLWLDSEGNILPAENAETHRDPEGFSVKKRVIVQDSDTNRFYCRVQLRDHMKEAEIVILSQMFRLWTTAVLSIIALTVIITGGSVVMTCYIRRMKEHIKRERTAIHKKYARQKEEAMKKEFRERRRVHAVDVILDDMTAHPKLNLSEDGKKVTCADKRHGLPDNPGRFDQSMSVLGKEGISSGRFYYEVDVRGKTEWSIGVVTESINRKGFLELSPANGCWTVGLWDGDVFEAHTGHALTLTLSQEPHMVGVFVDYEEGLVSFYDVDTGSQIFSFTGQFFRERLYPFFNPGLENEGVNSAPLSISSVRFTE